MRITWHTTNRTINRLSIFTVALLAAVLLPMLSSPGTAHADSVVLPGSSWLGGGGVDVMSGGDGTYNCVTVNGGTGGFGCSSGTVPSGEKWQCVELVNRLYLTKGWITSRWAGNGDTLVNSVPSGLITEYQNHISYIHLGDVVTLSGGTDGNGHAAIINTTGSSIQTVNQNTLNVYGTTSISSGSLSAGNAALSSWLPGYTIQAVVHAPGSGGGGTVTGSRPAVVDRSSGQMDIFYRSDDANSKLYNVGWTSTNGWGPQGAIANSNVSSNPTAVARTSTSMDIFYRDTNDDLINIGYNTTNGWGSPVARVSDGSVQGDPYVISLDSNHMDVFYKDTSNRLMDEQWNATTGWDATPFVIIGSPSAFAVGGSPTGVVLDSTHFHVLYRDTSNDMVDVTYSGGAWGGPYRIVSGTTAGDYAAISRVSTHLDVFYDTSSGGLGNAYWDASGGWSNQTWTGSNVTPNSGATIVGRPTVLSRDPTSMSVFYQDSAQNLIEKPYGSSGWGSPMSHTNNIFDNPFAVARDSSHMDVFYKNATDWLTDEGWNSVNGWTQITPANGMG